MSEKNRPHFYTGDTHFGHKNVIKYCNRPYDTVEEMNEDIISRWNNKVPKNSLVFHLGDVMFGGSAEAKLILPRLNGEKVLIIGNHDEESTLRQYFTMMRYNHMFTDPIIQRKVLLSHFPYESWAGSYHGVIHLHGHCHGNLKTYLPNRLDVGVDCHPHYEPFSSEEVLELVETQKAFAPEIPEGN